MSRKPTVLISILQLHKTAAGAMRNTFEQIRYFQSRGWQVHVVSDLIDLESVRRLGATAHKTWRWPSNGTFRRRFYDWQARRLVRQIRPQLVVGHGDLQEQDVLCLHNSVHLAHELIHGRPLPTDAEMYPIHTPQLAQRRFRRLIANSELMRRDLIRRFGIPAEDITVVYPAYDDDKFRPPSPQQRHELREELGLKPGELVVGLITSGNFKKRGVDVFLEALGKLPTQLRDGLRVWVVGKDRPALGEGPVKVEFLPVRSDVENYYRALDVFVLPARIEEFGRVQLEAMACGAPVVCTDTVGAQELLIGEARDFIVPPGDADALASAMARLLQDPALRARLSTLSTQAANVARESALGPKFDLVFQPWMKS